MDIATIVGLVMGFGAVAGGQLLEGGHISALLQPTAAVIVLGGTFGATFVSFPLSDLLRAFRSAAMAFFPSVEDHEALIAKLVGLAGNARKNGLISLEYDAQQTKDRFLGQGLEMVVDGVDPEEVESILQIELANFEVRHKASAEVFEATGGFAPTIGIIGAVLGLIHVMNNLSDTSQLGAGIAVAFVATIYGLVTANIVCIPLSTKLKKRLKEQILHPNLFFQWSKFTPPQVRVIGARDFGLLPDSLDQPGTPQQQEGAFEAAETQGFSRIMNEVQESLQGVGGKNEVQLSINERGLVISLKEAGFFPTGAAKVQTEAMPLLDRIAAAISSSANTIRIEGHTDNVPVKSSAFPSNWELSTARANSIVHYLIEKHGFKGARLSVVGYAEYRPIADNATDQGRRLNRRVDIVMLSRKGAQGEALTSGGK